MRKARAFVQHSMQANDGDSEGTPLAILEAGASGLPVVSTRHAGIPDVVLDSDTGLLVEEGDVDGMAQCMIRLAESPKLALELGTAARERIAEDFTLDASIRGLWRIVETVM
jgi:glycosyltransferase involved in cell wall biosynthesis